MKTENSTVRLEQFEVIYLDVGLDAALGILIFVSCYLLIALISYVVRVVKPRGSKSRKDKKRLWAICILNYCLTTLHAILTLVIYNFALFSTPACTAVKNLIVFVLVTLDATIYSFLWMRQYFVFRSTTFRSKPEKIFVRSLQWVSMSLIVGIYASSSVIIFGFRRYIYDSTESRCASVTERKIDLSLSYLWTNGSIALHSILLLLFAYPLAKSIRFREASSSADASIMRGVLLKCFLISLACVVTDLIVMMLAEHSSALWSSQMRQCVYNLNVLFNATLLTLTFKDWKSMFFPCM